MNKEEICKNCKYHYIEEISFDYPQSICNKDEKVGYTTEQGLSCDDFTYSKEYVKTQEQELDKYKKEVEIMEKYFECIDDLASYYYGVETPKELKTLVDDVKKYANLGKTRNTTEVIFYNCDKKYNILFEEIKGE